MMVGEKAGWYELTARMLCRNRRVKECAAIFVFGDYCKYE